MRSYLDILNESLTRSLLLEGKKEYEAMINPVLDAVKITGDGDKLVDDMTARAREKIKSQWSEAVRSASDNLRKQDRIVWYLRMMRMSFVDSWNAVLEPTKIAKLEQEYRQKMGGSFANDSFNRQHTMTTLQHYLSLPIPAIQDYQFRYQSLDFITSEFFELESVWKEQVKSTIEDDDSKVLIDFGNGWFWVNTDKAYCSKEASAMGHCGNEPRANTDDLLLSLRKKIVFGKEVRWEPHLTFILENDGYLTEMKGRGNEKPTEKYHPMIIALLKLDIIKGLRGGGYKPENNFSMHDLTDSERDDLVDLKPELGTVRDIYDKLGACDEVFKRLYNELKDRGFSIEGWEDNVITIETWNSAADVLTSGFGDYDSAKVNDIAGGDYDRIEWLAQSSHSGLESLVSEDVFDMGFEHAIAVKIGVPAEDAVKALVHMFPKSLDGVWDTLRTDARVTASEALNSYKDKALAYSDLYWHEEKDEDGEPGKVSLLVRFGDLVHSLDSVQSEDYDSSDGLEYLRNGDWLTVDENSDYDGEQAAIDVAEIDEKIQEQAMRLLMDLFHDDKQLSFGF